MTGDNTGDMFRELSDEERQIPDVPKRVYAPDFERFYRTYPRKISKGAAAKSWEKATNGMTQAEKDNFTAEVINAVKAQVAWRNAYTGSRPLPEWKHPSTWLNQACWLDELDSIGSPKHTRELGSCTVDGCKGLVTGYDYGLNKLCPYHFSMEVESSRKRIFSGEDLRQYLRDNPHLKRKDGEKTHDWVRRLRRFALARVGSIGRGGSDA